MAVHVYLSMTPESLVASMLPPEEFGHYMAVGARASSHGEVMFFDLAQGYQNDQFDFSAIAARCVPDAQGRPKTSVYLGVYRVLERIPVEALRTLWLTTAKGIVLPLEPTETLPEFSDAYYLYQELCPAHPLVASRLPPPEFARFMADPQNPICIPRTCFVQIDLADLAHDPENGKPRELYYPAHFWHLRGCLLDLKADPQKSTRMVDRLHPQSLPHHCIRNGFYVGDRQGMRYYAFPSRAALEGEYYYWWRRSAHY